MNILMICEFYDPALEFQENQLVRYYRKLGHEVLVLTSTFESVFDYYTDRHDAKAPAVRFDTHGATIQRLPYKWNILNRLRAYRGVAQQLESFRPDLIYIHDISPNIPEIVRYKKRDPACRLIMDIHMDYANSGKSFVSLRVLHGVLRRYFLDRVRPHLERILPIVPGGIIFMREIYRVPDDEMELLPLGADTDQIAAVQAREDRTTLRARLGYAPDDLVIFTGGKLAPRKRTELLLEAIDTPELAHARVVIAGTTIKEEADYNAALHAAADRLGDRVSFAGWQRAEGVYELMHAADVAVFPASQSVMWQQAIGSGLPLVVGDAGRQYPDYLNRHDNARVVPTDQISAAAYRAILTELTDPAVRARMSAGARQTAGEFLDWNMLAKRTIEVRRP